MDQEEHDQWEEFDEEIAIYNGSSIEKNGLFEEKGLLRIGILYEHPFGARVVNNLINKQDFCTKCEALCINCRVIYPWFSSKIFYVHKVNRKRYHNIESCWEDVEKHLVNLDTLIVIGIPNEMIIEIPDLALDYNIKSVIFPVEDPRWISPQEQLMISSKLTDNCIEFAFPRPFCNLNPKDFAKDSIIYNFIKQFRIGYPKIEFSTKKGRILKTKVIRSAPCGATYYLTQYLRNEQFNSWNTSSIEKRISDALRLYPCMASKLRDDTIEMITRNKAEQINQKSIKKALESAEKID